MNEKLKAVSAQAGVQLAALVRDADAKITAAWANCIEEAAVAEATPRLKLAFAITLDLEKDQVEYDLTFASRSKFSVVAPMPDSSQPELPIGEDDSGEQPHVTIRTPGG